MHHVECSLLVQAAPKAVFGFHNDPWNLTRILPRYLRLELVDPPAVLGAGAILHCAAHLGPLRFDWTLEVTAYDPPRSFVDAQRQGPFGHYNHTHIFEPHGSGTRLIDAIDYALPGGPFSELASRIGFENRLRDVLRTTQRRTRELLENAQRNR